MPELSPVHRVRGTLKRVCERLMLSLTLWRWLPVMLLLAFGTRITETLSLSAPYVVVPLAAYLGFKHGRAALVTVTLGVLPQVVGVYSTASWMGGCIDVALLALAACHLAAR